MTTLHEQMIADLAATFFSEDDFAESAIYTPGSGDPYFPVKIIPVTETAVDAMLEPRIYDDEIQVCISHAELEAGGVDQPTAVKGGVTGDTVTMTSPAGDEETWTVVRLSHDAGCWTLTLSKNLRLVP